MTAESINIVWRKAGAVLALVMLLVAVLYQQTVFYLTQLWNNISVGEYAHGYLVLAICVYLIISDRKRIARINPCPSYAVLPLVLLASLSWLVAVLVDVEMLQAVGLLLVTFTVVWAVTGHQIIRLLIFPIAFIIFAIPIWFPLSPILQDITADVVFWITRLIEVPAFRQENLIVVPAGVFSIEEACSGLRYLLAALTLGALYGYLNYVSLPARIAVVLVAAATAVVANIIRVFMVVYVGYTTDMQHPWVTDHLMLGWYVFGGLVAILLFLDSYFYRQSPASTVCVDDGEAPVSESGTDCCNQPSGRMMLVALLSLIFAAIGPALVYQRNHQAYPIVAESSVVLPVGLGGWSGPIKSNDNWLPVYKGSINQKADYQRQSQRLSLYVAYYPRQLQGQEVINVKNHINDGKVWHLKYARAHDGQVHGYNYKEQVLEKEGLSKRLVWYWYNIGGKVTNNKYEAKVLQLSAMLKNKPQAYVAAVSVVIVDDELEKARASLTEFITAMQQPLDNIQISEK